MRTCLQCSNNHERGLIVELQSPAFGTFYMCDTCAGSYADRNQARAAFIELIGNSLRTVPV